MGMVAILVMWPGPFEQTFVPLSHGYSIWNLASISPVVSEEKMFKEFGRRTDRQRTDDRRRRPTYPISSPMSLRLRWAKKQFVLINWSKIIPKWICNKTPMTFSSCTCKRYNGQNWWNALLKYIFRTGIVRYASHGKNVLSSQKCWRRGNFSKIVNVFLKDIHIFTKEAKMTTFLKLVDASILNSWKMLVVV